MSDELEKYIRRAHAERAFYIANLVAAGLAAATRVLSRTAGGVRKAFRAHGGAGLKAKRRVASA